MHLTFTFSNRKTHALQSNEENGKPENDRMNDKTNSLSSLKDLCRWSLSASHLNIFYFYLEALQGPL